MPVTQTPAPTDVTIRGNTSSSISWPAVFAGSAVTGGLILVMLPLAVAAGLSLTSAYPQNSASASTIGWIAVLWTAFMYLFSISAGGYVAGRLRPRVGDANLAEARFRDLLNGLVFWGVGMIISALITLHTVTYAAGAATTAAGQAVGGAAAAAANLNADYVSDYLLRTTAAPATGAPQRSEADARMEVAHILTTSLATGNLSDADRKYLTTLVAQRTGLSEADAKTRVDEGVQRAKELKEKVQATAETARKAAAHAAFWTAILSLLSGIAAAYAARLGGQHRDENRFY